MDTQQDWKTLLIKTHFLLTLSVLFGVPLPVNALDTIEAYIHKYPNQEPTRMMNEWLREHKPGTFSFTGLVDDTNTTVVTPQATVDYG